MRHRVLAPFLRAFDNRKHIHHKSLEGFVLGSALMLMIGAHLNVFAQVANGAKMPIEGLSQATLDAEHDSRYISAAQPGIRQAVLGDRFSVSVRRHTVHFSYGDVFLICGSMLCGLALGRIVTALISSTRGLSN